MSDVTHRKGSIRGCEFMRGATIRVHFRLGYLGCLRISATRLKVALRKVSLSQPSDLLVSPSLVDCVVRGYPRFPFLEHDRTLVTVGSGVERRHLHNSMACFPWQIPSKHPSYMKRFLEYSFSGLVEILRPCKSRSSHWEGLPSPVCVASL